MIRKLVLAIAVAVLAAGCAKTPPPQDTAADKAKLQADALGWFDRFAAADSEGLANLYAEDAIVMPPGGAAITGRPAIKSYLGAMASGTKAANMTLKAGTVNGSDVCGEIGWISGSYTVEDSTGNAVDSGNYISIHHRADSTWVYTRDIWNSDRPPAPPAPASKKR
jgi:ketosteroid isomerase-like protein